MKAGRELDALVAEKVMGWKNLVNTPVGDVRGDTADGLWLSLPQYSTEIAAAWEVVEKLKCIEVAEPTVKWACAVVQATPRGTWQATFRFHTTEADTAPLAICLAALKIHSFSINSANSP